MGHDWQKWVAALAVAALLWFFWRRRHGILQQTNVAKSFRVMGILAIILIIFVGALVLIARQS